ncbi:ferrochelatase [candidate division GN15 bacterium]|nr:ferrochelatase [candidate division GN15 bacterium]
MASSRTAVLLIAMGGPDSLEAIPRYLYNIFSDRTLIQLPGGAILQKPFARLISRLRSKKVAEHYKLIGGSSPLLKWTAAQAGLLESTLVDRGQRVKSYVGMRYYEPTIAEAVRQIHADGCDHIIVLPMYPQYTIATTGSSVMELGRVLKGYSSLSWDLVKDFHDYPPFVDLVRDYIDRHTDVDDILLFTAHSLPRKFVDEGDPYVDQVKCTAELAAGGREYHVSFQSRTGPVEWVGPDTIDETKRLVAETNKQICLVPVAFVCDHIETLYELDIELPQLVGERERLYRLPMFNDDPRFAEVLADLVSDRIPSHAGS